MPQPKYKFIFASYLSFGMHTNINHLGEYEFYLPSKIFERRSVLDH